MRRGVAANRSLTVAAPILALALSATFDTNLMMQSSTSPAQGCRHCPLRGGQPVSIWVNASNHGSASTYRGEKRAVGSDQL